MNLEPSGFFLVRLSVLGTTTEEMMALVTKETPRALDTTCGLPARGS